jgi:putative glycosyltransferase
MKLSIVTTLYYSAPYIDEFYQRITHQARLSTDNYEIIFVNDGSPDSSLGVAQQIAKKDPGVKVIDLPKNYGHHRAMMIGLEYSCGEYVYLTDIDLEEPPESLGQFWDKITSDSEIDVVYGITTEKERPLVRSFLSNAFYTLFNHLSDTRISPDDMVSRIMRRNYVDALLLHPERELFIAALWPHMGFRQIGIKTAKTFKGASTYTLGKRFKMAVSAVTSFSSKPLVYIFYLGMGITLLAAIVSIFVLAYKMLANELLGG